MTGRDEVLSCKISPNLVSRRSSSSIYYRVPISFVHTKPFYTWTHPTSPVFVNIPALPLGAQLSKCLGLVKNKVRVQSVSKSCCSWTISFFFLPLRRTLCMFGKLKAKRWTFSKGFPFISPVPLENNIEVLFVEFWWQGWESREFFLHVLQCTSTAFESNKIKRGKKILFLCWKVCVGSFCGSVPVSSFPLIQNYAKGEWKRECEKERPARNMKSSIWESMEISLFSFLPSASRKCSFYVLFGWGYLNIFIQCSNCQPWMFKWSRFWILTSLFFRSLFLSLCPQCLNL